MTEDVHAIAGRALDEVAASPDLAELEALRQRYLGRRDGALSVLRRGIGGVADVEARRQLGQTINELVERVAEAIEERHLALEKGGGDGDNPLDLTRPAPPLRRGRLNPVSIAAGEIRRIFAQLGYEVVSGPEVEYDRYNFTLVNQPPGHPARDEHDTFYIDDFRLLRTHTWSDEVLQQVVEGQRRRRH